MKKETGKLLQRLRSLMSIKEIQAYIVPSSDAHGSEYLADKDKRRQFVCGMSGSAGTALVTQQRALLWTDSRYYLQASQQLDSNWELMKDGLADTPSIGDWLGKNLPAKSLVGVDATLYSHDMFDSVSQALKKNNSTLIHVEENLVDIVWRELEDFKFEFEPLKKLSIEYAGEKTSDKLKRIRAHMAETNAEIIIVSSLNEIAWVLNLRGSDVPYGTVFFAYLIITSTGSKLFTKLDRIDKSYLLGEDPNFEFYEYDEFFSHLTHLFKNNESKKKVLLSGASSHAIHALVPEEFVIKEASYVDKLKVVKNDKEIESAIRVHLKDSVALVELFHKLLAKFENNLDEFSLAELVNEYRARVEGFMCPSFETICATGPNGAVIHYKPEKESCSKIESGNVVLIDSGGHYFDMGTTDVTRTVFLGDCDKIDKYEKECFTRVLKGHIQLALKVFPVGIKSELLDSFARQSLWQVGLDYKHGTGHGVGAMLNVHELPIIASRKSTEIGFSENMIVTIEPGYYEDGKFGIRIENCVRTVKAETPYSNGNFLRFEPLTFVPIQREFVEKSLLSEDEVKWLNNYHAECCKLVGDELKKRNKLDVYEWLVEQTKPL